MNLFFDVPVLLIVFNRPDLALKVLNSIKAVKPKKLYIGADGPRLNKAGEDKICQETRESILQAVDWDCEVKTLFQKENLGSGLAPATAISWFFEQEEMGIILEDDCVPVESFFHYSRNLLNLYKDDLRVMHISGFNDQDEIQRGNASYYFSYFPCGWGWATWKRAWKFHKLRPENVDQEFRDKLISKAFYNNHKAAEAWLKHMYYNLGNAWDYQWDYAIWQHDALCITPNISLIKNVGFDERATHTSDFMEGYTDVKVGNIDEIIHPEQMVPDESADKYTISKRYHVPFLKRMYGKFIKKVVVNKS
jgi:hypothetical protein